MVDINVNVQDTVVVLEELQDCKYNVVQIAEPRRLRLSRGMNEASSIRSISISISIQALALALAFKSHLPSWHDAGPQPS